MSRPHDSHRDPFALLTARQREVLTLIAEGMSNLGIAERLGVSEKAIVRHASRIYESLGVPSTLRDHRRVLAVRHYLAAAADAAPADKVDQ